MSGTSGGAQSRQRHIPYRKQQCRTREAVRRPGQAARHDPTEGPQVGGRYPGVPLQRRLCPRRRPLGRFYEDIYEPASTLKRVPDV